MKAQGNVNAVTHITGYGEIDFQGAAQTANSNGTNSFQPRLRQAYVAIDRDDYGVHVLGGQTWSLATMFARGLVVGKENIPTTIDQQYLPGFTYTRQAQIRVTKDLGPFTLGVSAENPQTTVSGGVPTNTNAIALNTVNTNCSGFSAGTPTSSALNGFNTCNTTSINRLPDFVGKAAVDPTFFGRTVHAEGYGLLRDFSDRIATTSTSTIAPPAGTQGTLVGGHNKDVFGGGVGGSVLIPVLPDFVEVQGSALFGQGIGRYGAGGLPDVTYAQTGKLKPISESQILAGVTVHPTKYLDLFAYAGQEEAARASVRDPITATSASTGYGNVLADNSGCAFENSTACNGNTRRLRSITGGVYYTPYKGAYGKLQIGAQYSYTERVGFVGGPTAAKTTAAPKAYENILLTSLRYFPF